MKLSELLNGVDYSGKPEDCEVVSIIHDSRKVKQGSLFVAIKGFEADGHDYILDAVNKGAVAIMSNGRSLDNLPVPVVKVKNPRACMSQISANFYNHPSKIVSRQWSLKARWNFRYYNELKHKMDERLDIASIYAKEYCRRRS